MQGGLIAIISTLRHCNYRMEYILSIMCILLDDDEDAELRTIYCGKHKTRIMTVPFFFFCCSMSDWVQKLGVQWRYHRRLLWIQDEFF